MDRKALYEQLAALGCKHPSVVNYFAADDDYDDGGIDWQSVPSNFAQIDLVIEFVMLSVAALKGGR